MKNKKTTDKFSIVNLRQGFLWNITVPHQISSHWMRKTKRYKQWKINHHHHHHHHQAPYAQISLTPPLYQSLSPLVSIVHRFRQVIQTIYPISVQSCCRYVLAGYLTPARPYEGVHGRTSLVSSSLLLKHCTTWKVRLILMVLEMGGRWQYCCCFVECCFQKLFNITNNILALYNLEKAAVSIGLHVNTDKTEYIASIKIKKETSPREKWFSETSGQVHQP